MSEHKWLSPLVNMEFSHPMFVKQWAVVHAETLECHYWGNLDEKEGLTCFEGGG